jgi:vacuolar-type H+-ATPase subunit H
MPNVLVEEVQTRKGAGRGQKEMLEAAPELSVRPSNPLEDLRKQAEVAYNSYVDAQRKMARAYRVTERSEVANYKEAEERANKVCDEAIQKAPLIRSQSEHDAREAYEKAVENAAKAFEETVEQALKVCRQTIQQEWQAANELSERMWDIFQGKASS